MHIYRLTLIFLHFCSTLTYFPHLITHIRRLPFRYVPFRSQLAYCIYWINYSLFIFIIFFWCVWILARKKSIWQLIQITNWILIVKFIYTLLDMTVRILLNYAYIVIIFDIIHLIFLIPAIGITILLIEKVKNSLRLTHIEQCI